VWFLGNLWYESTIHADCAEIQHHL